MNSAAIAKYDTQAIANSFGMLRRHEGRLFVEGVAVEDLVARHGSPLFVISETALRHRGRRVRDAFRRSWSAGDVLVMPSVKANPVIALQRILAQEGFGADLVHAGELEVAVRAGIGPRLISLNGSGKDRATVERAVGLGARITIDDVREIELARAAAQAAGKRAVVRMRLRPYVDTDARMEATGVPIADVYGTYKSGIPYDSLPEVGKALSMPELDVSGVMMHMGRYTTDLDIIGRFSHRFGELAAELSDMWHGWTPATIDIGGGFAPPVDGFGRGRADFTDPPTPPEIERYAEVICRNLESGLATGGISPEGRTLEIEPGRSLFAPCGIHVATVLNVKRQTSPFPFTWVDTDTSVTFLTDIQYSSARPPVVLVNDEQRAPASLDEVRIVGHSCHADVLARSAFLPPLQERELLAFCFTGAYHEVGSSNFNVMPRPATVLVRETDSYLVRRAETVHDVLARDVVPDHLSLSEEGASS